eukprot:gene10371-biopygen6281
MVGCPETWANWAQTLSADFPLRRARSASTRRFPNICIVSGSVPLRAQLFFRPPAWGARTRARARAQSPQLPPTHRRCPPFFARSRGRRGGFVARPGQQRGWIPSARRRLWPARGVPGGAAVIFRPQG